MDDDDPQKKGKHSLDSDEEDNADRYSKLKKHVFNGKLCFIIVNIVEHFCFCFKKKSVKKIKHPSLIMK
jgi:hypothetical protein